MRIRRGLIWFLGLVVVLGCAQFALQYYGSRALKRSLAQARDWAVIRVGSARFWLWGTADLDHIQIAPSARLDAQYGLPRGYAIDIARLHVHRLRFGWNDGPVLISMNMTARHVILPVPVWRWPITVARSPSGSRLRAPTLRSLGVTRLSFNADMFLGFMAGYAYPELRLQAKDTNLARIRVRCSLVLPQGTDVVRDPAGLEVRNCRQDYQDLGLMKRFEARMATENGVTLSELRREITVQIARDAARSHWPLLSAQAVQGFIRDPRQILRLKVNPKTLLPLDDAPQRVWAGLPAYLGLNAALVSRLGGSSR